MPGRKHTRCAICGTVGKQRYAEVMWRFSSDEPWNWVGGWLCAACRVGLLDSILVVGSAIVAWDG